MKYVIVKIGDQSYPVIFPNHFVHDDMAKAVMGVVSAMRPERAEGPVLVSAGDVTLMGANCGGLSTTTGLQSRGAKDAHLIEFGEYTAYMDLG